MRAELDAANASRHQAMLARWEAEAAGQAALDGRKEAERAQAQAERALAEATGLCRGCQETVPECLLCLSAQAVVAHVPCGHRVYCDACNPGQPFLRGGDVECEVCRRLTSAVMRVY